MARPTSPSWTCTLALALLGAAPALAETPNPDVAAGRRIAERNCGGCHAVAQGFSPLADAPPFRDIHRRYPAGGLPQILQEGMVAPLRPPEEGSVPHHPRMPMAELGDDEVAALTAYLKSLEPARKAPGHKP
jgi:mono/diheme cytochrome c family protein